MHQRGSPCLGTGLVSICGGLAVPHGASNGNGGITPEGTVRGDPAIESSSLRKRSAPRSMESACPHSVSSGASTVRSSCMAVLLHKRSSGQSPRSEGHLLPKDEGAASARRAFPLVAGPEFTELAHIFTNDDVRGSATLESTETMAQ